MNADADRGCQAPLAGIRVVDFSRLLPGPLCTRLLTDLGADVIRVEPPGGDYLQTLVPGLYEFLNAGKRAIRVDLKAQAGRGLVLDLVATADVVVEGFRPGVADRLGVGVAACSARRPGLVYCSISGFGEFGSRRDQPGHDIIYEAAGGAYAAVLAAGDTPTPPHVPFADTLAGAMSALSICAGLLGRASSTTEKGLRLDVSIHDCVAFMSAASRWAVAMVSGEAPEPEGMAHLSPGQGIFRLADGRYVAIAAVEDKFWLALCGVLGRPDLCIPPYDTHSGRMRMRRGLRAEIARALRELPSNLAIRQLRAADVPIEAVATVRDVLTDTHLAERGVVVHGDSGLRLEPPVRYNGRRSWASGGVADPAASLDAILDELGRSESERRDLFNSGVIGAGDDRSVRAGTDPAGQQR